jgi:small-conductance mechanosensitive channel
LDLVFASSAGGNPVFSAPFVEEDVLYPTHILGTFVKNQMAMVAWVCARVFCFIPLVFMSVFVLTSCCFYYYNSVENYLFSSFAHLFSGSLI